MSRLPANVELSVLEPIQLRGWLHAGLGALLLSGAILGLRADVAWLAQPFYAWVWWGYILMLDGYSFLRRGESLLTTRLRFFFPICIWSITFWFFFELLNARIQNWYYVGVFPEGAILQTALFTFLAFSTVFMGIFQTADALNASGLWRNWKGRRRRCSLALTYGLQVLGLAMAVVALVFPYYLAPLIWGSFTFLVDPWNYRRGARSLLRDLEQGDYGLVARLLLAGLICGVVWESLNFFAPQKWIYTVRGLEGLKVFEMPLIGFLGFPALAMDCVAAFAMGSSWFLGNRSWEYAEDLSAKPQLHPQPSPRRFWLAATAQVVFWMGVSLYATPTNIGSVQLELRDLQLTSREIQQLRDAGIVRPRQLLRATEAPERQAALRHLLTWSPPRLEEIRQRAKLYTFKGIGHANGRRLEAIGVRTLEDLKTWEPEPLYEKLLQSALSPRPARLRLDFVRAWVLAARDRTLVQNSR